MQAPSASAGQPLQQVPQRTEQQGPSLVPVTLDTEQPAANLPAGVMPRLVNWTPSSEGLTPRLGLRLIGPSTVSSARSVLGIGVVGTGYLHSFEDVDIGVAGSGISLGATVVGFSATSIAYWTGSYWSALTISPTHAAQATDYQGVALDSVNVYDPVSDLNAMVWTVGDAQAGLGIWQGPNYASAPFYSILTQNALAFLGARAVGYFDTRVVVANVVSGVTRIPQRVVWSERGSLYTYAEPTGGTEDLVSMRGGIVRIMDDDDRMVLVGDEEIWAGTKFNFPFDFQFQPLDRTIGTGDPRTVVRTPIGIMFQGYDYNVYLLPKGASKAQPVGNPVWPTIRAQQNAAPSRKDYSFAVYDAQRAQYTLFPTTLRGGSGNPFLGFSYNIHRGTWSTSSFVPQLSHGVLVTRDAEAAAPTPPSVCYLTSVGTIARAFDQTINVPSYGSISTTDLGSAFSASAFVPIGNPHPQQKLFVRDLLIDYSNASCPSGSSITLAFSSDFGQTIDKSVGVALPFTQYSRQTVVNVGYSAIYPSVDVQYQSQVSGHFLRIQRLTALIEGVGQPGVGG